MPAPRGPDARVRAVVVLACLVVLVSGRSASAQQYPPAPIGPVSPAAVDAAGPPTTPPPFGSDPVDAPRTPGVTGTIDTDGTSAVPGTEVLGLVVPNPDSGDGGSGVLPTTGPDIVVLVAWGLILLLLGRTIVKAVRDHRHRRDREREQRLSRRAARREVPLLDTSAFATSDAKRVE